MSYLNATHLVFSGDFLSDVSTVNNDPAHYNNATFQPSFQEFGQGASNGWWNPEGGATFQFQNCTVKKVSLKNGQTLTEPAADIVIGKLIRGAEGRNTGKMVDLDPQEQGSSELWGVKFRLVSVNNETLLEGDIRPTGFRDLQTRQQTGGQVNGQPFGGTWTSVVENITWGPLAERSPFLAELKATTQQNRISINLNAYGYYYAHAADGRFSMGRILGTIAPWEEEEPDTFAACRRLYGIYVTKVNNGLPIIFFSNTNFAFDAARKSVSVDFGSSFPIADSMGGIVLKEKLYLAVSKVAVTDSFSTTPVTTNSNSVVIIGEVPYESGPDWLNNTGGIVTLNNINNEAAALLENHQLVLLRPSGLGQYTIIAREAINGVVVRCDNFVNRLDYNQTNQLHLYAYQWGQPMKNVALTVTLEKPTAITPVGPTNPICELPGNNYPANGISFNTTVKTDKYGRAVLPLTGNRIDNPRLYIDGQIYILDYQLDTQPQDPAMGPLANDNIFIHLRDYFEIPAEPQWSDIATTMTQFANLYPIMSKYLVNLADPVAMATKRDILKFAFSQNIHDPIYMPVTRDLSENKRLTILKWLENPVVATKQEKAGLILPGELLASPAEPDAAPTINQERLKNAVRAKNGAGFVPFNIDKIFND
ncbi:hypothetical protein F0L74_13740 [Chitinophaga agrisoli]|uniref:Uncharacterized protein n=1 Tax=Chitinophaga agrisoli TaxID=2607653 RepID=A0A5B2VYC2_9BACT|nr:hypothetical protein F0L74_13740 [Chitinophaga agrisoli]